MIPLSSRESASKLSSHISLLPLAPIHFRICHPILSSHYIIGHQDVQPCTGKGKNADNSWALPHITIQPLQHHDHINMYKSILYLAVHYAMDSTMCTPTQSNNAGFQVLSYWALDLNKKNIYKCIYCFTHHFTRNSMPCIHF